MPLPAKFFVHLNLPSHGSWDASMEGLPRIRALRKQNRASSVPEALQSRNSAAAFRVFPPHTVQGGMRRAKQPKEERKNGDPRHKSLPFPRPFFKILSIERIETSAENSRSFARFPLFCTNRLHLRIVIAAAPQNVRCPKQLFEEQQPGKLVRECELRERPKEIRALLDFRRQSIGASDHKNKPAIARAELFRELHTRKFAPLLRQNDNGSLPLPFESAQNGEPLPGWRRIRQFDNLKLRIRRNPFGILVATRPHSGILQATDQKKLNPHGESHLRQAEHRRDKKPQPAPA